MKYGKMKKAPGSGSDSYQTPYSNIRTSGSDGDSGYVAGGLDIIKAVPGKGKRGTAKPVKKARRAY